MEIVLFSFNGQKLVCNKQVFNWIIIIEKPILN